jgi:predicted amidophosphoribosyltransferase
MSEPEIARRCSACGISVRKAAMFCPQCGNPITQHEPATTSQAAPTKTLNTLPDHAAPAAPARMAGTVRERVEKIKHVSHVVIDQAAYDPSLRFLLVAAVLFVLFVILMILSKVLG